MALRFLFVGTAGFEEESHDDLPMKTSHYAQMLQYRKEQRFVGRIGRV